MKYNFLVIKLRKKYIFIFLLAIILLSSSKNLYQKYIYVFNNDNFLCNSVIIDPGHGGIDSGAYCMDIFEKNINLHISLKLKKELESKILNVYMTRNKDVSLENRSFLNSNRYRRDLHARKEMINNKKNDLFISVHTNSNFKAPKARGVIIFYKKDSKESEQLAKFIARYIDEEVFKNYLNISIKTSILSENFYILNNSKIPGVLIEVGFINNDIERNLLLDSTYQSILSKSICNGVLDYLKTHKSTILNIMPSK